MKTIHFIALLLFMLLLSSCNQNKNDDEFVIGGCGGGPFHRLMWLYFSFQDVEGNDLLQGLGDSSGLIKRELFTLGYIHPDLRIMRSNRVLVGREIWLSRSGDATYLPNNGYDRLRIPFSAPSRSGGEIIPFPEWITIRLSMPHIFGDDAVREITTYWKSYYGPCCRGERHLIYCYRVEFEGREFFSDWEPTGRFPLRLVTIVLGDD